MNGEKSRSKTGTLAFCVILYTILYTCRLNLSAALLPAGMILLSGRRRG